MLRCRRVLVVLFALALVLPAFAVNTRAQQIVPVGGSYWFESDDGDVPLSDVRATFIDAGYGDYIIVLTFVPSQEEIDALLDEGSHVDFEITLLGLDWAGDREDFAVSPSDYVRHAGATVTWGDSGLIFRVMGLNIQKRWIAGAAITVTASIFGLEPTSDSRPRAEVDLISTEWRFADVCEDGEIAYERETNDIVLRYCGKEFSRSALFDEDGRTKFRFE